MKIAVLSDIHGNVVALRKVLDAIRLERVDELLIAGDFIGYYYRPDEVLIELSRWKWAGVQGNHDALLKKFIQGDKEAMEKYRVLYGSALDVVLKVLSQEQINFILSLPEKREMIIEGKRILLCHGAPWDSDEYIYPDALEDIFKRIAGFGYNLVIMGHTHYPMIKSVGGCIVLNPGAVGQPRDQGSSASWALVDLPSCEIIIKRVRFDSSEVIKEVKLYDPSRSYLMDVLTRKQL